MTTLDKTIDSTRFLIFCVCFFTALQVAILAVLLLRDSGREGTAANAPVSNCIREFGFNPKVPRVPDGDCQPAPVNISGRA